VNTGLVTIYGSSDDLIEIEGEAEGCDEYNAEKGVFLLHGDDRHTRVTVEYDENGCWQIGVAPADEGILMHVVTITSDEHTDRRLELAKGLNLDLLPGYTAYAQIYGVERVEPVADDA
jgi:hypothetical protein